MTIESIVAQEPITPSNEIVSVEFDQIPFDNFDSKYFKPINVVFVLDKSSSMLQGDKLELMKYSLFQLTNYLRPEDKMSIVTYSSTAKVLVPPTAGSEKDFIKKPIEKIRPGGGTAGGDGIKLGFEQAVIGYIKDGANIVVVITDGAFNKNSDDYQKSIEKHQNFGINLSVVGIKNLLQDEAKMKEAAKIGNGRYVPIFKLADAQRNLINEIRISAFRK
jgi:Ca-activated chloride channel family protein